MGPLGLPELIFILVLALLIFGPKRLPEIGRTIGRGLGELRRASDDLKRSLSTELALDEEPRLGARRPGQLAARVAAGSQPRLRSPASATVETVAAPGPEAGPAPPPGGGEAEATERALVGPAAADPDAAEGR